MRGRGVVNFFILYVLYAFYDVRYFPVSLSDLTLPNKVFPSEKFLVNKFYVLYN